MHRIRKQQIQDVFTIYKQYNRLYASIAVNGPALNSEYTEDDVEEDFMERVADPQGNVDDEDESSVIERRLGLAIDEKPDAVDEHPLRTATNTEREFEIRRSTQIANEVSETLLARMFPHLFPFGRGHPGEDREIHVSVEECVKHYTLLSQRQFAEDELFLLVTSDRISLRNMYIQNHFSCQRFPHLFDDYEILTSERLKHALVQSKHRRQGCVPLRSTEDSDVERFLKLVEVSSRSVCGSNIERAQCRHKSFAYQTRFGQPALFKTLTHVL